MAAMKILFITDTMSSGGAERVLSVLVNGLCKDYEVSLLCLRGHDVYYELEPEVNVVFADDYCKGMVSKFFWLRSHCRTAYDLVVAFMVPVYLFTLASLLFSKVPVIVSERNDPRAASRFRKLARRLLIGRANHIVVQTESIKNYFPHKLQERISCIFNPISAGFIHGAALRGRKEKLFVTVGRLQAQKNHKLMIDAFADFSTAFPDYRLEIYGEGELRPDLQRQIDALGLETKVELKGKCNNLQQIMPRAAAFVMSSDYEGMSNAMLEAMYVGLPVVSTAVSGANELIADNVNGYLVALNDRRGFASALKRIAASPDSALAMGKAASDIGKSISPERIIAQWRELIGQYDNSRQKK